jgi:hypothetical protein
MLDTWDRWYFMKYMDCVYCVFKIQPIMLQFQDQAAPSSSLLPILKTAHRDADAHHML